MLGHVKTFAKGHGKNTGTKIYEEKIDINLFFGNKTMILKINQKS